MKDIVILGSSGFAQEMLWLLESNNAMETEWNILGFVDGAGSTSDIDGYDVIGDDEWLMNYPHPINAICGIGQSGLRRKVINQYKICNSQVAFPAIISKQANVSRFTDLGEGSIVCAGTIITTNVRVGNFVTINLSCTIGHETKIGDFVTINPGSNISGNVLIGQGCDIGTGTKVIQNIEIGRGSTIGAGAVIIRDVPENCTVVGNPGRIVKR